MNTERRQALLALTTAGLLWGTSVPLSKAALGVVGPGWLTVIRFTVAGVILVVAFRPALRTVSPVAVIAGAFGYGACIAIQNVGLRQTSVTHAALLIGAVPVLVAVLAVVFERAKVLPAAWAGFAVSLLGIAVVAGSGGGASSLGGDALVLPSVLIGAGFTIVQARLLPGQDVIAVSAGQFFASAALVAPIAAVFEGSPWQGVGPGTSSGWLAVLALATLGTVLPYSLFAYGQAWVEPHLAGAFLNLETLVAALLGATLFGESLSPGQVGGGVALLLGIYLSTGYVQRVGPVRRIDSDGGNRRVPVPRVNGELAIAMARTRS